MNNNLQLLFEIDRELDSTEVASLKFLCSDVLGRKYLENITDARDLFKRLSEQGLMEEDNLMFLQELLFTIKRFDLLSRMGLSDEQMHGCSYDGLSPYRKMLFDIAENTTNEKLVSFKFLVNLPRRKIETSATILDVLTEMEKQQQLTKDNVEELERILNECDKELARKVEEYRLNKDEGGANNLHPESQEHLTHREEDSQEIPRNHGHSVVSDSETVTNDMELYPMNSRPRGWCLIINNEKFSNPDYNDRKGTQQDAVDLQRVFEWLHFSVKVWKNQSGNEMREAMREYANMNHSLHDAFVVCVLSHGLEGTVMGADGEKVSIKDLYRPFTRCVTLAGKPKLFFIQACQGRELQKGLPLEEDGPKEQIDKQFEEDAFNPLAWRHSIASEADVLIGMATVEEFKSFRHTISGSIYIQALCKALESGCPKKEDILTILTRVNKEVSKGVYNSYKQMPQPKYTLTKKLVLTVD